MGELMIYFPFVVFGMWTVVSYKKHGLDVGTFILLLYSIISLCSILIDVNNYYSSSCMKRDLGVIAPIVYVCLLSFCIYPFYRFSSTRILGIHKPLHSRRFNYVVYFYLTITCIIAIVSMNNLQMIMLLDLKEVRNTMYTGDAVSFYDHLHGYPRYICAISSILAPSGFIMIPLFFYSLAFQKRSLIFNFFILAGSFGQLLIAMNIADRSNFFYWMLSCLLAFVLFKPYFTKESWRPFLIIVGSVVAVMLVYFIMVTASRFGERDSGTEGGIILYAGQSYLNFCYFFNELNLDSISLVEIFPTIGHYIFNAKGYFDFAADVKMHHHINIAVFSTFLGLIMSVSGRLVMVLYVLAYRLCLDKFLPSLGSVITLSKLISYWALLLVLVLGVFGYYYGFPNVTIGLFVWIILGKYLGANYNK